MSTILRRSSGQLLVLGKAMERSSRISAAPGFVLRGGVVLWWPWLTLADKKPTPTASTSTRGLTHRTSALRHREMSPVSGVSYVLPIYRGSPARV